jgi:hypothetical protein
MCWVVHFRFYGIKIDKASACSQGFGLNLMIHHDGSSFGQV